MLVPLSFLTCIVQVPSQASLAVTSHCGCQQIERAANKNSQLQHWWGTMSDKHIGNILSFRLIKLFFFFYKFNIFLFLRNAMLFLHKFNLTMPNFYLKSPRQTKQKREFIWMCSSNGHNKILSALRYNLGNLLPWELWASPQRLCLVTPNQRNLHSVF